jgi:hypothetical protein
MGVALLIFFDPTARGPDIATYLGFARSLFFDGDILLFNEFPSLQRRLFVTPTGYATALQNIGVAFFLLPWYAVAHGSVWLTNTLIGAELSADGFNALYLVWLNFGHWLYGVATLFVSYRWCRRYASRRATWLAVLFVTLASPFFYYATAFIPNSGIPSALIAGLFVIVWDNTRRAPTTSRWFLLGSLAGVLMCIANYNITFLCFPLVRFSSALTRLELKHRLLSLSKGISAFSLGVLIGFLPQLLTWRILFGSFFANPYAGQLAWLQPHIGEVLFSSYHGLFFYTPFLALALLGLIPLWRRDRTLTLSLMLAFLAQTYISSANLGWWAGGSFGQRYFLALTPLFMLCAAALFDSRWLMADGKWQVADSRWQVADSRWQMAHRYPLSAIRHLLSAIRHSLSAICLTHYFLLITSFLCFAWTYLLFLGVFANYQDIVYYYPPAAQWANQLANLAALPRLLSAHLLTIKSPLAPIMLLPFMLIVGLLAMLTRQLSRSPLIQTARFIVACALLPLLPTLMLLRAESVGAARLRALQMEAAYHTLPRAANDPDDTSYTYTERAVYHLRSGNEHAAEEDWQRAQAILPSNTWTALRISDLAHITHKAQWQVNEQITLSGYALHSTANQTHRALYHDVWVTLYWSVAATPVPTHTITIALLDTQGNIVHQTTAIPTQGQYAPSQWQVGALIRDTYTLSWPTSINTTEATVRVTIKFPNAGTHNTYTYTLANLKVQP